MKEQKMRIGHGCKDRGADPGKNLPTIVAGDTEFSPWYLRLTGVAFASAILAAMWILFGLNGDSTVVQAQVTPGITAPSEGSTVSGEVAVMGTATIGNFNRYELHFRPVTADDSAYTFFDDGVEPVINGQLGVWETRDLEPDTYILRLRVVRDDGNYAEYFASNITVSPVVIATPITPAAPAPPRQPATFAPTPTPVRVSGVQIMQAEPARTISMIGHGSATAAADHAVIRLFFAVAPSPDLPGFRMVGEGDLQQVVSTVQNAGVPGTEIAIFPFSRTPAGSTNVSEVRFTYRQPGNMRFFLDDLLNRLAADPSVRVVDLDVRFGVTDCRSLEAEAMRSALIDARTQADLAAQLLNVTLGALLSVSESEAVIPMAGGCAALETVTASSPARADTVSAVSVSMNLAATFIVIGVADPTLTPGAALDATPTPIPQIPGPDPALVTPTPETFQHIYQPGETIQSIADQYGVSVESILAANNLTPEEAPFIQPGRILQIPVNGFED
jgi:LysM repeat protein